MPTTYTHYKFGKDVLCTLPRTLEKSIEENRELFDIGLHGPDILFYYKALLPNPVSAQGYELHEKVAADFFNRARDIIEHSKNKAAARAYIYGFICHYALDSECHSYIEKIVQTKGISHSEIEMEFDRLLLVDDHINPISHLSTNHVHATQKNAEIIAPFFEDLTVNITRKALKSMITCHKLMLAPQAAKRKLIFGALKITGNYKSMSGMVMSEEPNPLCADYCLLLKKLYAGAVPLAAGLIMNYQKTLFQNTPLPERFNQTFGAGEHWQDLPL